MQNTIRALRLRLKDTRASCRSRQLRVTAWRSVHAVYRGMVREQWLAPLGRGDNVVPLSSDNPLSCENNLHEQICAH